MPSAGTPRTTVRLPLELSERIEAQLQSLLTWSPLGEWTVGSFIRAAIEEKLAKMARSRSRRPRRLPSTIIEVDEIPSAPAPGLR